MTRGSQHQIAVWLTLCLIGVPALTSAQYFGRNKVQYRTFDFQILKTDHFDLYYYPEELEAAQIASRMAERWYARLSRFFGHQLRGRQALILYAAPAHFRQTNAIEGLIGEGTGGVTEALKRRIVLPMSGSLADTDHVLGHELVHAFQFDMTGSDPREPESAPGILEFPLWFVEGMAEYLSLGPVDAQTAMWMRDAALHEKLPRIRDLDKPEYFPYRWGHAFWAYIGGRYGDRAVASLVRSAANPRFDLAGLARQLGTDPDALTADWHRAIRESVQVIADSQPPIESQPRLAISHELGGGRFNIGPRVSPDGRQVAFFSSRDRFSIELFVADAETGRIHRKLSHTATDGHFDSLEFLNSAGAWSPDGRTLAVTAVRSSRPMLVLIDPVHGRIRREVKLTGLDDAINPSFSPDGRSVVLSGNQGGLIDLYLLSLESGHLDRLTHDPFADLEPVFTPDGKSIVFVSERFSTDLATLEPGPLRLGRLNLATRAVDQIPAFLSGKHLSPQVSADGLTLTFIADPDGISNLYRMPIDGGPVLRLSSLPTGVAGITSASPALSASASSGRLAFSVFEDNGHAIYILDPANIVSLVAPQATSRAALLPGRTTAAGEVQRLLTDYQRGLPISGEPTHTLPYKQRLSLDMISQPTLTASVGQFGSYISGSVSAYFSDMLGDRMLGVGGQIGGTLADLGGSLFYVNRKHRWNWATAVEATPYTLIYPDVTEDTAAKRVTVTDIVERQTIRGAYGVTAYPLSRSSRLEFSGDVRRLSFTRDYRIRQYSTETNQLVERRNERVTVAEPLGLLEGGVAFVHDTSYFGATSPIFGQRYRLELDQSGHDLQYSSVLADWRRYFMPKRPVTISARALHYGRYGRDADHEQLMGLYLGSPQLVHGYGAGSITPSECRVVQINQCALVDNLLGSRLLVANLEVRAPLLGLFRGDIEYGVVPVEVAAFVDAGVAWTKDTRPSFAGGTRDVIRSVGGAARVNAFGLVIVEVAASRPLDRPSKSWQWQIGIRQGF